MIILLTLLIIVISGVTTIPFSIGLMTIFAVLLKRSWLFFLALGLGLFLDLIALRTLGYASLALTIFVFILFLYERKFETRTAAFVFISSFFGSTFYLMIFGYNNIFLQSLASSLLAVLAFKIIQNSTKSINQLAD